MGINTLLKPLTESLMSPDKFESTFRGDVS